jgi:hypothetical protein
VHDASNALDHPHELSRPAKILLILLVAYAVAVILPDTLRPTVLYQLAYYLEGLREVVTGGRPSGPHSAVWGWYPLGTLGFIADNDGKVTSVDDCGGTRPCDLPAWDKLQVGDRIDLSRTAMSDRRAVNQMVFVAHDRPVVLRVAAKANGASASEITLMPRSEVLRFFDGSSSLDAWTADHPLLALLKDVPVALPDRYWEQLTSPPYPVHLPVLAVPVAIRGTLSRIGLFGPHTNDEALDRDEVNIIRRLARAAAFAYTALDAEALRAENRKLEERLREAQAQAAMLAQKNHREAPADASTATVDRPEA